MDIVSAAANGTPGLGRYPPFKREVIVSLVHSSGFAWLYILVLYPSND